MHERISDLEAVGLELLYGMKEVMLLLGSGRHKEVRGDIFGFLEVCLEQYARIILEKTGELKNMVDE